MFTADPLYERSKGPRASTVPAVLPDPWPVRVRWSLRRAAPALLTYAAVRLVGMVCLAGWAWHVGKHPRTLLGYYWDAIWYWHIAEHGYGMVRPSPLKSGIIYNDLAFFPLYPTLIKIVAAVVPIGPVNAALVVSWAAAALAAWGMYAIGELLHGRRAGFALAVLWGVLPHGIVESMAYTETLLTACAAWSLYAVLTRRLAWAGTLAMLAGLTRPNGIAVAAAVWVAVAAEVLRRPPAAWRAPLLGAMLAPAGWLSYVGWVGVHTGKPLGYFRVQQGWGSEYDFGWDAAHFFRQMVTGRDHLSSYMALAVLGVGAVLFISCALQRQPLPLLAFSLVLLAIAAGGTNYFQSKPRFLLPAFPLLLPVAFALARSRTRTVLLSLGALAALSAFYGTYLLTVSRQAL